MNLKHDINDDALMERALSGDEMAFNRLYDRYRNLIFRLILTYCGGDSALAEELAQEAWIRVFKQTQYQPQGKFKAWLGKLCRNVAIDHFRKQQVPLDDQEEIDDTADLTDDPAARLLIRIEIEKAIEVMHKLPDAQREAFSLYIEGYSVAEIAEITEVNPETVKTRIRYAKDKLRSSNNRDNRRWPI